MAKLGIKASDLWPKPAEASSDDEGLVYPKLDLTGRQVDAAGLEKAQYGDEITVTCRVRVSMIGGQSSDDELPGKTLEVISMDTDKKSEKRSGFRAAYEVASE